MRLLELLPEVDQKIVVAQVIRHFTALLLEDRRVHRAGHQMRLVFQVIAYFDGAMLQDISYYGLAHLALNLEGLAVRLKFVQFIAFRLLLGRPRTFLGESQALDPVLVVWIVLRFMIYLNAFLEMCRAKTTLRNCR